MTTLTLTIEPELYQRVEETTLIYHTEIGTLFNQAIRRYLWELDRRKISEETKRYYQCHAELKKHYLGQYIAMHQGEVVDHDVDFGTLCQRVQQQFGRVPIMMRQVEEVADHPLVRRGFQLE